VAGEVKAGADDAADGPDAVQDVGAHSVSGWFRRQAT
jgi:hypothetical protein